MSDKVQDRLATYCAHAFPARQRVRVTEVAHISAGWESVMYAFALESGPADARQREDLILRIYPGEDAHGTSAQEYRGMGLLYDAGYPVPQVLVLEREDSPFGQPFVIMERIAGQMMWPQWFGASEDRQRELLTLFCELLVRLHSLDWRPFAPDHTRDKQADPYAHIDRALDWMQAGLARLPMPGFLPHVEWLKERRDLVPCERPSVIHWDYHPGNILLCDDGSAVVVDWTQVDVSDSRFDLAWTLILVGTHENPVWHDRILHEYERLAGAQVEQLAFFEVVACLKRLYFVTAAFVVGPEALGMREDATTMMAQQMGAMERVYDLLLTRTGVGVPEVEEMLARNT